MATWRRLAAGRWACRTANGFVLLVVRRPDGRWALVRPFPEELGEDLDVREIIGSGDRADLAAYRDVLRPVWVYPEGVTPDVEDLAGYVAAVEDGLKMAARWRRYSPAVGERLDASIRAKGFVDPDERWGVR